jgi:hypothetical protein
MCGRLQCTHMNERPEFGDPSSVFPSYQQVRLSNGQDIACRSIRTTYVGGKRDPGMVPDGGKCGKDGVGITQNNPIHSFVDVCQIQMHKSNNCNRDGF